MSLESGHRYGLPRMRIAEDGACVDARRSSRGMAGQCLCALHASPDRRNGVAGVFQRKASSTLSPRACPGSDMESRSLRVGVVAGAEFNLNVQWYKEIGGSGYLSGDLTVLGFRCLAFRRG